MNLTNLQIKKLKPADKLKKYYDGKGLYLVVHPTGKKKWRFKYRLDRKEQMYVIGEYGQIDGQFTLAKAREELVRLRVLVAKGINPAQLRKDEKEANLKDLEKRKKEKAGKNFEDTWDEYQVFMTSSFGGTPPRWQQDTLQKHQLRINKYVLPVIGKRKIDSITHDDLTDILLTIQDEHGALSVVKKVKEIFKGLFDWSAGKKYIPLNVAKLIPESVIRKPKVTHFKHATSNNEFEPVVKKIWGDLSSSYEVQSALKLAILTFMRPINVSNLKWSQVDFENEYILIEANEMKKRREFICPLSSKALSLLDNMQKLTGHTEWVFYSPNSTGKAISRDSLSNALRRNNIEINTHGFRHTASTLLHEKMCNHEAIELSLAHVIGGTSGIYNKSQLLDERRKVMQIWSDFIDKLKN